MDSLILRVARRDDYQELASWIAQICRAPDQHCLHTWSGESADVLHSKLVGYLDASELCYVLALQTDRIVGAMGSEYDEELGRGWLHGPHAMGETWDAIAAQLLARLLEELPASITQLDAYLNVENVRGQRFYARQCLTT